MPAIYIEDLIEYVKLLESELGFRANYKILDPTPAIVNDCASIELLAFSISKFIGLDEFKFEVSICEKENNVAGSIELSQNGQTVKIEISKKLLQSKDNILAILAHEITHKYLHKYNVYLKLSDIKDNIDNEILTDVATIYLGLGKLSLNGCASQKQHINNENNNTQIVTKFTNLGYLNHIQFSFVYNLVCVMRNIPQSEVEKGLYPEVIERLLNNKRQYKKYLDISFHNQNHQKNKLNDAKSLISQLYVLQDDIKNNIKEFQDSYFNIFLNKLQENQTEIFEIKKDSKRILKKEVNPCLAYLNALDSEVELDKNLKKLNMIKDEIIEIKAEVSASINNFKKIIEKSNTRKNSRLIKAIREIFE